MDGLEVETLEVAVDGSGKASIPVPAGMTSTPAAVPTFAPGNFQFDMAALAAEQAAKSAPPIQEQKAQEPEQPATAPATSVPDKFKNEDGTINQEKIEKSIIHAEEAYQKYADIERKLRQRQNEVAALKQGAPIQVPTAALPAQINTYSPFEVQVAQDLIQAYAEAGVQLPSAQALAQARVSVKLQEARHAAETSLNESLRERLDNQDRRTELESIAQNDPWVMSPEGIDTLGKIRESYPHVNSSIHPWTAAYDQHLANQVKQQRLRGQVQTSIPAARTAQPATPVQAASRVVVKPQAPNMVGWSSNQITEYVNSLPAKEQEAFYAKQGIRLGNF